MKQHVSINYTEKERKKDRTSLTVFQKKLNEAVYFDTTGKMLACVVAVVVFFISEQALEFRVEAFLIIYKKGQVEAAK